MDEKMSIINWKYLYMNGKRFVWVGVLMILLIAGCGQSEEQPPPDDLINKPDMVHLLMDVYNTEARIAGFAQNYDSSQQLFNMVEADLLARYGATPESYRRSMQYYFDHPDELLVIYEAVVDSLSYLERKQTQERKPD